MVQMKKDRMLSQTTKSFTRSRYQKSRVSNTLDEDKSRDRDLSFNQKNIFHPSREQNLLNFHLPIESIPEIGDGFVLTMQDL